MIFMSYYDLNWGVDLNTKKSTTKYVFLPRATTRSWKNKWQPTMALSTCQATKEIIWIQNLLNELGFTQNKPTIHIV